MTKIKIYIGSEIIEREAPSSWSEVSPHDFAFIASHNVIVAGIPIAAMQRVLSIDYDTARWILPSDWYALLPSFRYLLDYSSISKWVLPSITLLDGRECFPPAADFDNVSWEEFVFADQLAKVENWAAVAATLYRPYREHYTEDQDPRIPFTRFGLSNRLELFQQLPSETIKAFSVNYLALRHNMTKRYRYIFSGKRASNDDRGWVEITHEVLGQDVWQEQQLAGTSVNAVLSMINNTIHQNHERLREERRLRRK